ncbi:hypothetical protein OROGR_016181 [Orobanche gracilis]
MPSVGMRRSTRVFGARVLRSGRRLWTEPHDGTKNARSGNQWAEVLEDSVGIGEDACDACKEMKQENEINPSTDMKMEEHALEDVVEPEVKNADRMCGTVYRRKRKRVASGEIGPTEDRMCGKKFYRNQWRKKSRVATLFEICSDVKKPVGRFHELAIVVNGSSCGCGDWITCFLTVLLSYMARARIGVRRLSKFCLSEPIFDAYSSYGVLFLQDSTTSKNPCICIISGSKSHVPLFSINFSAIPSFFVHMQTSMHLKSAHLAFLPVAYSFYVHEKDEKVRDMADDTEKQHSVPSYTEHRDFITVESQISSPIKVLPHSPSRSFTKSPLRTLQSRNSRSIKKRRSSMRRKRGRAPLSFRVQKAGGTLATEFFRIRQESVQLSSVEKNIKELKCTFTQDVFSKGCSVNLLVTESDKCYREEGATITLESSSSEQSFLSFTKDAIRKYSLTPEKVMRPSWTNRFSHATIWGIDGRLKLEFFNKHDWLIFKELYNECYDRNMLLPAASVIPVPGVQEVPGTFSSNYEAYMRPDSYINVKDDELTRALVKQSAVYDMDSDDEAWLTELNDELCNGEEVSECVMPESFELIIDALEKGFHCNPNEKFDDQGVCDFCMHLERRKVVEAIHNYWVKKRKQKRAALVKVFQLYQPRRIQVIPKSILRKKRSFKRQASKVGRGKQRPLLQAAIVSERVALEQQNNAHKLQEAKAAAGRFEGLAILKRQKAQMRMANADLATYKALAALRIAEAAKIAAARKNGKSVFTG